eukprot:SAG11_NODE_6081_length_1392_cov_0.721578_2_plen_219_part_00
MARFPKVGLAGPSTPTPTATPTTGARCRATPPPPPPRTHGPLALTPPPAQVGPEKGISTYENPIDVHHAELYRLHLAQKLADRAAAQRDKAESAPAARRKAKPQPVYGAREKCGDAFWWGATYKGWLAKKSGTAGSAKLHLRRKWEKRYFALQGNRLLWCAVGSPPPHLQRCCSLARSLARLSSFCRSHLFLSLSLFALAREPLAPPLHAGACIYCLS